MNPIVLAVLFLTSTLAHADVGLPIVVVGWPYVTLNLLLIAALETAVLWKWWRKALAAPGETLKWSRLFALVLGANTLTTLLGYPVVAGLEALFPFVGLNLGWLIPFEKLESMNGYVAVVLIFTFVPAYFLSVYWEAWLVKRWLKGNTLSRKPFFVANAVSYLFLTLEAFLLNPLWILTVIGKLKH